MKYKIKITPITIHGNIENYSYIVHDESSQYVDSGNSDTCDSAKMEAMDSCYRHAKDNGIPRDSVEYELIKDESWYRLELRSQNADSSERDVVIVKLDENRAINHDGRCVAQRLDDGRWSILGSIYIGKIDKWQTG